MSGQRRLLMLFLPFACSFLVDYSFNAFTALFFWFCRKASIQGCDLSQTATLDLRTLRKIAVDSTTNSTKSHHLMAHNKKTG